MHPHLRYSLCALALAATLFCLLGAAAVIDRAWLRPRSFHWIDGKDGTAARCYVADLRTGAVWQILRRGDLPFPFPAGD